MKNITKLKLILLLTCITFIFSGCNKTKVENATLNVSVATSLKDTMEDIKIEYVKLNKDITITYNFGSSGSLQQQIEQGAPTDVFIPASTKQMDMLKEKGIIINETDKTILKNKVVLIVPKDDTFISGFKDLEAPSVKKVALGEPTTVPVGQYAQEILKFINILDKVNTKAVYAKDAREVLTWVETKNADAGIVYETDAKTSDKVKIAEVAPEKSHKPVVYPAAVIKSSKNVEASKEFIKFLSSDKAKAVFQKYGFIAN